MRPQSVPSQHRVVIKFYTGGKSISDSASKSDSTNDTIEVYSHIPDEDVGITLGANWNNALDTIAPGFRAVGTAIRGVQAVKQAANISRMAPAAAKAAGEAAAAAVAARTANGALRSAAAGSAHQVMKGTSNITFGDPALSALMYTGSDNPKFSLNLQFNSEGDAYADVLVPIMNLTKMTLPKRKAVGVLEIPGPSPFDEYKYMFKDFAAAGKGLLSSMAGNDDSGAASALPPGNSSNADADGNARAMDPHISVQIGNLLYFRSVVIVGLDIKFGTQVDSQLRPIHAQVRVDCIRFTTPLREDVEEMFFTGKTNGQQQGGVG
jgi:hypothetical protein